MRLTLSTDVKLGIIQVCFPSRPLSVSHCSFVLSTAHLTECHYSPFQCLFPPHFETAKVRHVSLVCFVYMLFRQSSRFDYHFISSQQLCYSFSNTSSYLSSSSIEAVISICYHLTAALDILPHSPILRHSSILTTISAFTSLSPTPPEPTHHYPQIHPFC